MRKNIPNLGALQAFEASARLGSFARAGDELALTQSAVSRQVAALEQRLGIQLFTRVRRRLVLTEVGREYSGRIRRHLEMLQRDTQELSAGRSMGHVLNIAVIPTFATQWLIPRLADFARDYPGITVNLSSRASAFSFEEQPFDAAIHSGDKLWPDTRGIRLMSEGEMVPVCSRRYADQHDLSSEAGFSEARHLHLSTRPNTWRDWYEAQGWEYPVAASRGPRYDMHTMTAMAASAGLGIGLLPRILIESELRHGSLVIAADRSLDIEQSYFVAYPAKVKPAEALETFMTWLAAQARRERPDTRETR